MTTLEERLACDFEELERSSGSWRELARVDFRLLGTEMVRRSRPLALPGLEAKVAAAIARKLAAARPAPDLIAFEAVDAASPWPVLLAKSWPSRFRPWLFTSSTQPGPSIDVAGGDFESWLAGRSCNFRRQVKVAERRADEQRARMQLVDSPADCKRALAEYRRLHLARRSHRGGSSLNETSFAMVEGGELLLFSYGFDEEYAHISPVHLIVLDAIEDAFRRGDRRVDFGGGDERHKLSFAYADADAPLASRGLVFRSRRYPLTRARLAPAQSRWLTESQLRR